MGRRDNERKKKRDVGRRHAVKNVLDLVMNMRMKTKTWK